MKSPVEIFQEVIKNQNEQNDLIFLMSIVVVFTMLVTCVFHILNGDNDFKPPKKKKDNTGA